MIFFLDCEFDGFGGKLLSMALVSSEGHTWYEVISDHANDKWVQDNVIPILNKSPVSYEDFKKSLFEFLSKFSDYTIIVDWPDDIKYFCESIITGPGTMMPIGSMTFKMIRVNCGSKLHHNALEDAKGMYRFHTGKEIN